MEHQLCTLTWRNFESCVRAGFHDVFSKEYFSDVTLVSEDGKRIKAHRILVSLSSSTLRTILQNIDNSHPVVYLTGIHHSTLLSIIKFIYLGETVVSQDSFPLFMEASQKLKIAGLEELLRLGNTSDNLTLLDNTKSNTNNPLNLEKTEDMRDNTSLPVFSQNNSFDQLESVFETEHYVPSPLRFKTPRKFSGNIKSQSCDECGLTFPDKTKLCKHKASVHDKDVYLCKKCDYIASKKTRLIQHVKSSHSSR